MIQFVYKKPKMVPIGGKACMCKRYKESRLCCPDYCTKRYASYTPNR